MVTLTEKNANIISIPADRSDNITSLNRGTGEAYIVRRLRRDNPELADQVERRELSANAAAIKAGFRRKTISVPVSKPSGNSTSTSASSATISACPRITHSTAAAAPAASLTGSSPGPGGVIFAEDKSERGKLRPEQEAWRDRLLEAGATWYLWRPADLADGSIARTLASISTYRKAAR